MTTPATQQPEDASALAAEASSLTRLGKFEAAVELASRAIAIDGAEAGLLVTRAWALENLGRDREAADDYRAALDLDPAEIEAMEGLGNVLYRMGDRKAAAVQFQAAVDAAAGATDPDAGTLELAGWCLFRLERHDEAAHSFRTALTLEPGRASARFDLALTLLCSGKPGNGRAEYERALEETATWEPAARRAALSVAIFDLREQIREREGLAANGLAGGSLEILQEAIEAEPG